MKKPSKSATPKNPVPLSAAQMKALQQRAGVPHEVQDYVDRMKSKGNTLSTSSARAFKTFASLATDSVAPAHVTDVVFDVDGSTTAQLVRVYLSGKAPSDPNIVDTEHPHGTLHSQVVGTFVTVIIEVAGNPNDIGVVNIQNAEPSTMKLKVSDGPIGTKPLYVTG